MAKAKARTISLKTIKYQWRSYKIQVIYKAPNFEVFQELSDFEYLQRPYKIKHQKNTFSINQNIAVQECFEN